MAKKTQTAPAAAAVACPNCGGSTEVLSERRLAYHGVDPVTLKPCKSVVRQRRKCGCGRVFMHGVYLSRETDGAGRD